MTSDRIRRREEQREFIDSLTPDERGYFAEMLMRSLRGSWRNPRERAHMIDYIGQTDDVRGYSASRLRSKAKDYFENIGRGYPDGRYWRSYYQEVDRDISSLGERRVRELAAQIPDDMTWDDWMINDMFDNDEP